jgi:hypothetical protein
MSLPAAWVDRIFEKLSLVYGQSFLRRWDGIDLAAVKADWAHELRGFAQAPNAIAHGLAHLPTEGQAPTVLQFRQLCVRAPMVEREALTQSQSKPDPQRVAATLARLRELRPGPRDPKGWAWGLKAREERDPKCLSAAQRDMWRAALALDLMRQQRLDEEACEGTV